MLRNLSVLLRDVGERSDDVFKLMSACSLIDSSQECNPMSYMTGSAGLSTHGDRLTFQQFYDIVLRIIVVRMSTMFRCLCETMSMYCALEQASTNPRDLSSVDIAALNGGSRKRGLHRSGFVLFVYPICFLIHAFVWHGT